MNDFCGIGSRILLRLENLGIQSVKKIREYPKKELVKEFGACRADFLYNLSYGRDFDEVVPNYLKNEKKSISRSLTLTVNTADKNELNKIWCLLSESSARELRKLNLASKTLQYYWLYEDFSNDFFTFTNSCYLDDGLEIYKIISNYLNKYHFPKLVRKLGLRLSFLMPRYQQLKIWRKDQRRLKLVKFLDEINDKYGELTIKQAILIQEKKQRSKVGGFYY